MRYSLLLVVVLCTASLFSKNWQPSIEPRGITNGYRQGIGGELLIPIRQNDCSLFFGQALAGRFQDEWVGSLGLGYRSLTPTCCWAWGVNGFVDGVSGEKTSYGQGGVGAEVFGPCCEGRINGYFPFRRFEEVGYGDRITLGLEGRALFENWSGFCVRERNYAGFDVEGGYGRDFCYGSVWGYAGYYYFNATALETIQGPRLRLVYRYDGLLSCCASQLITGLLYEYDQVRGNRLGVEIGIRIPLGHLAKSACCPPSSLLRRMGDRIVRQEGILRGYERFDYPTCKEPVLADDGTPKEVFFIRAGGEGDGTQRSPMDLDAALQEAGPGAILVLSREGGDFTTSGITLKPGQCLRGFGKWGWVAIDDGWSRLYLEDKGGRAALRGNGKGAVVTLGSGSSVSGISVSGGEVGIRGAGISEAVVANVRIGECSRFGLQLENGSDVTLNEVTMRGIGDWLIDADRVDSLIVHDLVAVDTVDNGIRVKNSDRILLEDLTLELKGDVGIQVVGGVPTIRRAVVDGESSTHKLDYGIALKETDRASLDQVILKGIDGYALLVEQATSTLADRLDVRTKADEAIRVVGGEHFALRNSSISGAKEALVMLNNVAGHLNFTGNTLDGAQSMRRSAIEVTARQPRSFHLIASRNTISHSEGGGVKVDVTNGATLDLTFNQNTLTSLGGIALWCHQNGAGGEVSVAATQNTLANVRGGMTLRTGSYATDSAFNYHVGDNTFSEITGTGMLIAHEAFSKGPAKLTGTLSHNTLSAVSGPAIHLFSDVSKGPDHIYSALVQSNQISQASKQAILAEVDGNSGGVVTFKFLGNQDGGDGSAIPYSIAVGPNRTAATFLTMKGNRSSREGISLSDKSGMLEVTDFDHLSDENYGLGPVIN